MTAPNRATLFGRAVVDELVAAGVTDAAVAPGSRSTPLTVALAEHDAVTVHSHLDERSAAFYALGRGRAGAPTAVVTTSGTATANLHPAVMEADEGRVPLLALTADRPAELQDSGANQTADQTALYGDAPRYARTLPEPAPEGRRLRSVRTTVARAVAAAAGTPAGPVHLNCPFAKPLEPTPLAGDVPEEFAAQNPLAADGRDGPFVAVEGGTTTLGDGALTDVAAALSGAERPLLVAGPADPPGGDPAAAPTALADLARALDAPLLADPLSGLRFGDHVAEVPVVGGYDAYVDVLPAPDVVVRVGASPTSKRLRKHLRDADARQFVVDPAGGWREAEFTATDLLAADPGPTAAALSDRVESSDGTYRAAFERAEAAHRERVADADGLYEGGLLADVAALAPDPAAVVVSNSMPVRDLDRFGAPRPADLAVHGNRGVSGIDGVTSTALGVGSATDVPLVLVTGDLAYYHDMNGLLALARCGVDATVVLVNNDGGGIFHMLPIEDHDPPFTEQFRTPHGLDFAPTGDLYDLAFERVADRGAFRERFDAVVGDGTTVLEVQTDAADSHRTREALTDDVRAAVRARQD
jgi:2-succinyl-5-enolpyruvyl-6-hydroxy-3-cyclohexene-1-carboxylate synthase